LTIATADSVAHCGYRVARYSARQFGRFGQSDVDGLGLRESDRLSNKQPNGWKLTVFERTLAPLA